MKFSATLGLFLDLGFGLSVALIPTLKGILASPSLLLRPQALSRLYMANLWVTFGDGIDEGGKDTKDTLITPNAYGLVLDIGAGHGHTVRYLNRARVSRYIALEPNTLMHSYIRAEANKAGFHEADGTLVILGHGAEDTQSILTGLNDSTANLQGPPIDTLISILTLCTIPEPQRSVHRLVRDVLKPGGQFLMYEHVLNKRSDVAWWQRFWTPVWTIFFDGCRLDRPSDVWVKELKNDEGGESPWRETSVWGKVGEEEEDLFCHAVGRFIKK